MKTENKKKKLELYNSNLPRGYKKEVAKRAGVSRVSVSCFFSGKNNSVKIENAVLDIISELKKEHKEKLRAAGLL